jgi:hypothetical protein
MIYLMNKHITIIIVSLVTFLCFLSSFLILLHQKITFGTWFQIEQILHHETFAIIYFAIGAGILAGATIVMIVIFTQKNN